MKRIKILWLLLAFASLILAILYYVSVTSDRGNEETETEIFPQSADTNDGKDRALIYYINKINEKDETVNVLLLGLDARIGDNKPRCDGIHMVSFLEDENKIIITSVPRGISIDLPGVASESAYISNACHYKGIEYAVSQIENITGIYHDYLVKAGFSQLVGLMRILKLPTVSSLQFLRNRRFGQGDFQRSHNQALFIKDMIVNYFESFMALPTTLKYLAFTLLDTDIEFNEAMDILERIEKSGLYKNPDNIALFIKQTTNYSPYDMHFDFSGDDNQLPDQEYQGYQEETVNTILNIIQRGNAMYDNSNKAGALGIVTTPYEQRVWEQVKDEESRHYLHFELLRLLVLSYGGDERSKTLVKDFIEQMAYYNDQVTKQAAEELLQSLESDNE